MRAFLTRPRCPSLLRAYQEGDIIDLPCPVQSPGPRQKYAYTGKELTRATAELLYLGGRCEV